MGICSYVYRWLLPDSILCPILSISKKGRAGADDVAPGG